MVGKSLEVTEEQVRYIDISFVELTSEKLKSYDSALIMRNNFFEAAESKK
mgnify:CR=1 FL=1